MLSTFIGQSTLLCYAGGGERRGGNEHLCRSLIIMIRSDRGRSGVDVHWPPFSFRYGRWWREKLEMLGGEKRS